MAFAVLTAVGANADKHVLAGKYIGGDRLGRYR